MYLDYEKLQPAFDIFQSYDSFHFMVLMGNAKAPSTRSVG